MGQRVGHVRPEILPQPDHNHRRVENFHVERIDQQKSQGKGQGFKDFKKGGATLGEMLRTKAVEDPNIISILTKAREVAKKAE